MGWYGHSTNRITRRGQHEQEERGPQEPQPNGCRPELWSSSAWHECRCVRCHGRGTHAHNNAGNRNRNVRRNHGSVLGEQSTPIDRLSSSSSSSSSVQMCTTRQSAAACPHATTAAGRTSRKQLGRVERARTRHTSDRTLVKAAPLTHSLPLARL